MNQKSLDKLSLCQNGCYCMTKTIKGLCGKCGEIKSLDKNKTKEPVDSKLNKTRSTGKSKELNSNYGESAINKPKELEWADKVNKKKIRDGDGFELYGIKLFAKDGVPKNELWVMEGLVVKQKIKLIYETK